MRRQRYSSLFLSGCFLAGWIAVLVGGAPSPAIAAENKENESKRWYQEGTKRYNLGDFEEAIDAYKKGYDAKADPVFLFNIAQSYRLWGKPERAIFFYKSFLRNMPDAPNRAEVERRIDEMQALQRTQGETEANAPPPVTPPATVTGPPPPVLPEPTPVAVAPPAPVVPAATAPEAEASLTASQAEPEDAPLHERWWFWAGIGAAVVAVAVVVAVAASGGASAPDSDFPVMPVFR
jgi:tetratricopeptide (TPR) repeat protein